MLRISKLLSRILCKYYQYCNQKEKKIKVGDIKVNEQLTNSSYVLKHKDKLQHRVHKHEPPVSADAISIIYSDERLLVIDKPSSIPVICSNH